MSELDYARHLRGPVKRLLVCGSRGALLARARIVVQDELAAVPRDTVIVHGGALGVDVAAGLVAVDLGLRVEVHPADWLRHGSAASSIRNVRMLDSGVQMVLAVWDGESPGTRHTLAEARKRGLPCRVCSL